MGLGDNLLGLGIAGLGFGLGLEIVDEIADGLFGED